LDGPAQAIMACGALAYIQKPFSFDTLAETIKKALDKS